MRRQGLVPEWGRPCRQSLQKIDDIGRCDARQISDLFLKTEIKKAVGKTPVVVNCSLAQAQLTAQVGLICLCPLRAFARLVICIVCTCVHYFLLLLKGDK